MPIVLFLKSHIKGYTRRDGTFVREHEDSRVKKKPIFFHGTDADISSGKLSLRHFSTGALADHPKGSGWVPAVYLTDSKEHAAEYGEKILEVPLDVSNSVKINAVSELSRWARELGYSSAQRMIDDYYDGNAYAALDADSRFNDLAREAASAGKHVVVVNFGNLMTRQSDKKWVRLGKIAIVVDEKAL